MTETTTMTELLVLALRGGAAVGVLAVLAGGIPRVVQLGLAVVFGLWTAAVAAPPGALDGVAAGALALIALRELAIGSALGLAAALPLLAASTAGRLVDAAADARGPYGALFSILAAAVFVGIDGHVAVITAISDSFRSAPLAGGAPDAGGVLAALAALVPAAVQLAIPWLVTAAVVAIAVGVGTRVAGAAALHAPAGAAVPAALVMMTATLVGTLATGIAALVR